MFCKKVHNDRLYMVSLNELSLLKCPDKCFMCFRCLKSREQRRGCGNSSFLLYKALFFLNLMGKISTGDIFMRKAGLNVKIIWKKHYVSSRGSRRSVCSVAASWICRTDFVDSSRRLTTTAEMNQRFTLNSVTSVIAIFQTSRWWGFMTRIFCSFSMIELAKLRKFGSCFHHRRGIKFPDLDLMRLFLLSVWLKGDDWNWVCVCVRENSDCLMYSLFYTLCQSTNDAENLVLHWEDFL